MLVLATQVEAYMPHVPHLHARRSNEDSDDDLHVQMESLTIRQNAR